MGSSSLPVVVLIVLSCCFSCMSSLELAPVPLTKYLYPSTYLVTVSGSGTGGVMAQALQIAHSKYIKGCAAFSSTFYRCGPPDGNPLNYLALCSKDSDIPPEDQYQVSQAVADLHSYDSTHIIDSLKYMRDSKLYVYVGLEDPNYRTDQQLNIVALYEHYVASPYFIYTRVQDTSVKLRVVDASHPDAAMCPKTPQEDGTVSPNCTSMSAPAEALGFLLGGSSYNYVNPFYPYFRYVHLEPLRSFNQSEFTVGLDDPGLDDVGYYYVPRYCQLRSHARRYNYGHKSYSKPCLVHVYLHSCGQGREFQGTTHIMSSNYLEIAEQNYIIMLFPQVLSSAANPLGCFDFYGYTGILYATKNGPQLEAIWRMLERLLYLMPEKTTSTYYRASEGRSGGGDNSNYPTDNKYPKGNAGYTANKSPTCTTCGSRPASFYRM